MAPNAPIKSHAAPRIFDHDGDDPSALINLVPEYLAIHIRQVPAEYWRMKEKMLHNRVAPEKRDYRIRLAFWECYDRVMNEEISKITPELFIKNICSLDYFYKNFLQDHKRVAWMLTPPGNYATMTQEALYAGLEKLRDVIELPILVKNKDGQKVPDYKLIKELNVIVQFLDNRVKGSVPKQLKVEARATQVLEDNSAKDIDAEIRELEAELNHSAASKQMVEADEFDGEAEARARG